MMSCLQFVSYIVILLAVVPDGMSVRPTVKDLGAKRPKAKKMFMQKRNSLKALSKFMKWFKDEGGIFHPNITLRKYEFRNGQLVEPEGCFGTCVQSTGFVASGEIMFDIPGGMLITPLPGRSMRHRPKDFDNYEILALKLISELESSSGGRNNLQPYFDVLPTSFFNVLRFQATHWRALSGNDAEVIAKNLVTKFQDFSHRVTKNREQLLNYFPYDLQGTRNVFSQSNLQWAMSIVWSRAFVVNDVVPTSTSEHPLIGLPVLAPGIDFMNHRDSAATEMSLPKLSVEKIRPPPGSFASGARREIARATVARTKALGRFQLRTMETILPKKYVLRDYRPENDFELLFKYGFRSSRPESDSDKCKAIMDSTVEALKCLIKHPLNKEKENLDSKFAAAENHGRSPDGEL